MRGGQAIYCLGIDYMHPGLFYIGKVLPTANKTPRREHFSVMPSGYHFRQQVCLGRKPVLPQAGKHADARQQQNLHAHHIGR